MCEFENFMSYYLVGFEPMFSSLVLFCSEEDGVAEATLYTHDGIFANYNDLELKNS